MGEGTVLVRRSALGDVVLLGSITAAVPRPVTVLTDARWVDVASRLRGVDRAVPWETPDTALEGRVVDLQGSLATRRRFPGASRIHKRSVRRRAWLWWGVGAGRPSVPTIYAEAAGVVPRAAPWIDVPRQERDALVLVPGAAWAPKRPDPAVLVACGEAWAGPIVVLGGPDDGEAVGRVADALPGAERVVEAGFDATWPWLARARVCVAGDTGLLHLAAACGAVPLALFGPTHPGDGFFPYADGAVVQRDLVCRPCSLHRVPRCRMGDLACQQHPPETVVAVLQRLGA